MQSSLLTIGHRCYNGWYHDISIAIYYMPMKITEAFILACIYPWGFRLFPPSCPTRPECGSLLKSGDVVLETGYYQIASNHSYTPLGIDININIYLIIFTRNCVAVVSSLRKNGQSKCRDVSWGLQPLSMLANVLVAASILLLLLRLILFGSSLDCNAREGRWQARCMCISLLISCVWYNCKKFLLLFVHKHCLLLISKECPVFTDTYNIA